MPTLITPTGLTRFGNMTYNIGGSSGLDNVFDANNLTSGYVQATTGYVGVTFGTPRRIHSADFVSPSNGYDASGSTTSITLKLYAKTGSAPAHATDGVLLATMGPFTDVNVTTTKTLESTDQTTEYDHAWGVVQCGVWSVLVELRFYEADEVIPSPGPDTIELERFTIKRICDTAVDLTYGGATLSQFTVELNLTTPARVVLDFRADVEHRGGSTGYNGAISVGASLGHRFAAAYEDLSTATVTWLQGKSGRNLCELNPQHYEAVDVTDSMQCVEGFHQFFVSMNAATDASPYQTTNGLARILVEGGKGNNMFLMHVDHGAQVLEYGSPSGAGS